MKIDSEAAMLQFGEAFAKQLSFPAIIELVGDVGTGKTTFTRGLARGLNVAEAVTSPSFTISKRYVFHLPSPADLNHAENYNPNRADSSHMETSDTGRTGSDLQYGELIHYDFYRLDDPGIMRDELVDAVGLPGSVVVIEWGGGVADLLPESKYRLELSRLNENQRDLQIYHNSQNITDMWKTRGKLYDNCGKAVENNSENSGKIAKKMQISREEGQ